MADTNASQTDGSLSIDGLEQGDNASPTLVYSERGYPGVVSISSTIFEECQHELRWPEAGETFKKMCKDGAIAPAVNFFKTLMMKAKWEVKIPEGYEDRLKTKANFLRQVMDDMDHPWEEFIADAATFFPMGFSVCEKVYRERRKANGSKYDDGFIGIKKLPLRSQDSIDRWEWKNKGREVAGLWQRVAVPSNKDLTSFPTNIINENVEVFLPRKKYLHFKNRGLKNNPWGESPLVGCWQSWKYKQAYQENEAISVASDAHGFKVLYLPSRYFDPNASEGDQAAFNEYKKIMANIQVNKQSGLILPLVTDDSGNKLFEFEIKNLTGQKQNDVSAIIGRYTSEILVSLFSDVLSLGTQGGGSFSLAETKVNIIELAVQSKLDEIKSQINNDLIPQIFALNGWETDVLPFMDYGKIAPDSLEEVGKFVQRVAAVSMMPKTPETVNWIMDQANIPYRADMSMSTEDLNNILTPMTSGAGQGMSQGMPSGTGSSNGNNSATNSDNAA